MNNCCIRGAITAEENTKENILENTKILLQNIIKENNIKNEDIISILFTMTKDLNEVYPAVAAREIGITEAALMCVDELYIKNSLKMCIRVMVTINTEHLQKDMKHFYMKGAEKLRPDIVKKNKKINIAIDGPAGSGKSTIAKSVAKQFGILYADTGAMYRTVGLYCIKNNIDTNDEDGVIKRINDIDINVKFENGKQLIYLGNDDVTEKIRTQEVASAASNVAKIGKVREMLVQMQKKTAEEQSIVMDGRDIGTHVLPNADVKIYMEADVEERAKRRCNELKEKGIAFDYEKIKEEIIQRDNADKNRSISPLRKADDAILIDTSNMNIEEVTQKVAEIIKEKCCLSANPQ